MANEHQIRLRGGWECEPLNSPGSNPCRLTLPTRWPTDVRRRFRLTRRFGQPPLEAGSRVVLQLEHMPGIQSLELNGEPLASVSPGCTEYEIPLDARAERHHLVLLIDTAESSDPSSAAQDWGHVSLVIHRE